MAKIQRITYSPAYVKLSGMSSLFNERGDCTVKALSILCDVSYGDAHEALKAAGRKDRTGADYFTIWKAIKALGWSYYRWDPIEIKEVIKTYPGRHKMLKNITTHHPRRFPQAWEMLKGKRLLLGNGHHVAAFRDGSVHDWSINRCLRVTRITEIFKEGDNGCISLRPAGGQGNAG